MTSPLDPVFASTFLYSACKIVGVDHWHQYIASQRALGLQSDWPALRTLYGELPYVCAATVVEDASTYIDRARCVMAGRFLLSDCDVWLTIDDDIYADVETLRRLLVACRETRAGIAVPYLNRDGHSMTFRWAKGPTEWLQVGSLRIPLRTVDRVGFGLVALHRDLVARLALHTSTRWFRESLDSPARCPHLFVNSVDDDGTFMGEDFHFSRLCESAGHPMRVLLEAPCEHAGLVAMLDEEGHIRVADPARAEILDRALREREKALAGQSNETHGA